MKRKTIRASYSGTGWTTYGTEKRIFVRGVVHNGRKSEIDRSITLVLNQSEADSLRAALEGLCSVM